MKIIDGGLLLIANGSWLRYGVVYIDMWGK